MVLNFKQLLSVSFGISKSIIYASQGSMPLQDWNWKFKGLKQLQPATEKQFTINGNSKYCLVQNLCLSLIWYEHIPLWSPPCCHIACQQQQLSCQAAKLLQDDMCPHHWPMLLYWLTDCKAGCKLSYYFKSFIKIVCQHILGKELKITSESA